MSGTISVDFCKVCKRELKKTGGNTCTFCSKLYAQVKLRLYARGLTEAELIERVKQLPEWQKLRGPSRAMIAEGREEHYTYCIGYNPTVREGATRKALKAGRSGLRPIGVR